jgi:Flp pilus assembly protein TadD
MGDSEQSSAMMERALDLGNAGQLHQYGRQLVSQGKTADAMAVFQRNAEQNPEAWFIGVGLARGHSALADFGQAAEHMRTALEKAPEDQKAYIQGLVDRLESGEDIN